MSDDLLDRVIEICEQASNAINDVRRAGFATEFKDSHASDPVTAADTAADAILSKGLTSLIPGSRYFGEESSEQGEANSPACWIVDPLDGTKEFVRGIPEYVVSVLLQMDGENKLAAILNPATGDIIAGSASGVLLNGSKAKVTDRGELPGATALASRTETEAGEWDKFSDLNLVTTGSVAWKCARVAAGLADLTFTLRPRHVWDVGAGLALVGWAGGRISNKEGNAIAIAPTHAKVRCFLASNNSLHAGLLDRLTDVPLGPDRRN
ncbi:MAG: inositol monophosphatase family protein [Mariprofundaceae bacterium]